MAFNHLIGLGSGHHVGESREGLESRECWVYGCDCASFHPSPTLLYLCSYANFRAFFLGAILVHARHRGNTGVLNESPQPDLDCELGYCWICGIWLPFRVEGGLYFLFSIFLVLDPGF